MGLRVLNRKALLCDTHFPRFTVITTSFVFPIFPRTVNFVCVTTDVPFSTIAHPKLLGVQEISAAPPPHLFLQF